MKQKKFLDQDGLKLVVEKLKTLCSSLVATKVNELTTSVSHSIDQLSSDIESVKLTAIQEKSKLTNLTNAVREIDNSYLNKENDTLEGLNYTSSETLKTVIDGLKTETAKIVDKADASDVYTKEEISEQVVAPLTKSVQSILSQITTVQLETVESLPEEGKENIIYLVKKTPEGDEGNIYDEYVYINSKYEHIGDTTVDLSQYYQKGDIDTKLGEITTKLEELGNKTPELDAIPTDEINKLFE